MSASATLSKTVRLERRAKTDRLAGRLAGLGATLGVLAGVVDVAVGSSIRGWIGNKLNPTPLGLITVLLSAVALAGAVQWERPDGRDGDRRLATVLAFLIPAGICFTTIGRLWYLPGMLLLGAAVLVAGASTRDELTHAVTPHHWLTGLTALLGGYYLFLGGDALPKPAGVLGILGAIAIWAALVTTRRSHRLKLTLLIAGALPFAIATWWSVVTPLIAVLVLSVGPRAIRSKRADPHANHASARNRARASAG
jgi:drug/metabolite transporter (DMT)-like permease